MEKWDKIARLHRMLRDSRYCVPLCRITAALQCSEATFFRLRNFMVKCLGAPIVFNTRYKGYEYDERDGERFELPGLWLTKEELEALCLIEFAAESLQGGPLFESALANFRNRFKPVLEAQRINQDDLAGKIRILNIGGRTTDAAVFRTLAEAVLRKRRVAITHTALGARSPEERIISPLRLIRYKDNWYVDAFCHLRNDLREFAISRINAARIAEGIFTQPCRAELEAFFAQSYGIFTGPAKKTARILFTGIAAREVSGEEWHPLQKGEVLDHGSYLLQVPYGDPRELIMDILRWGPMAEVLEPEELRGEIAAQLAQAFGNYCGNKQAPDAEQGTE
jgi:predicted DNA-binding transcriptional regulator YafY